MASAGGEHGGGGIVLPQRAIGAAEQADALPQ